MFISSTHKSNFANAIADSTAQSYLDKISSLNSKIEEKESELSSVQRDLHMAQIGSVLTSEDTPKEKAIKSRITILKSEINSLKSEKASIESAYNDYMSSGERADVVSEGLYSENQSLQQQQSDLQAKLEKGEQFKKYAIFGGIGLVGLVVLVSLIKR